MRRTRSKRPQSERGVALLLVLGAIAILTVMLTEFQDETTSELAAALADRDALKAEYMAKSAVNLSRLLLASEPTVRQGISFLWFGRPAPQIPVWEFSDRILGAFNDTEGIEQFLALTGSDMSKAKNLGMEGGKFEVTIVDEDSKLDLNLASRGDAITRDRLATELLGLLAGEQFSPLFDQRDRDNQFTSRVILCSSIVDWADPNETLYPCDPRNASASGSAPEDSFYDTLPNPYRRKNAPYDSLEELFLVRGIGEDIWSTFFDPDPSAPRKRTVTVWGQGPVNVNTANAQTLLAVVCANSTTAPLCLDINEAQKFIMAVTLIRGFIAGMPLFDSGQDFVKTMQGQGKMGPMLAALGIKPVVFTSAADAAKTVTNESKMFSIYADGIVPGYRRKTRVRVHAVIDFRAAPPPGLVPLMGQAAAAANGALPGQPQPPPGQTPTATQNQASALGAAAISQALVPNPAGTVVYYRIE